MLPVEAIAGQKSVPKGTIDAVQVMAVSDNDLAVHQQVKMILARKLGEAVLLGRGCFHENGDVFGIIFCPPTLLSISHPGGYIRPQVDN